MQKVFMLDPTNCYILLALSHDGAIFIALSQLCLMVKDWTQIPDSEIVDHLWEDDDIFASNGISNKASKINWESPPPPKPGSFDPDAGDCGQFNPEHFA